MGKPYTRTAQTLVMRVEHHALRVALRVPHGQSVDVVVGGWGEAAMPEARAPK